MVLMVVVMVLMVVVVVVMVLMVVVMDCHLVAHSPYFPCTKQGDSNYDFIYICFADRGGRVV
jgi:hypothetical protein